VSAPLLSELREPVQVGRYYMVPALLVKFGARLDDWPVLGPAHSDERFFPHFHYVHWHIDVRFTTAAQRRHIEGFFGSLNKGIGVGVIIEMSYRHAPGETFVNGVQFGTKPHLVRRRCWRGDGVHFRWHGGLPHLTDATQWNNIARHNQERDGKGCEPAGARCVRTRDGRKLCPHQRVDLTNFSPDAEGTVVCPAHGLRVQVMQ
jgi:hypothetical protein